jgi:MarR family transcriptional regulator, organic hydroperoxide resistance regulator
MNLKPGLGTRLRALQTALDDAVEHAYREVGLDFRPRYFPIFRMLMMRESMAIGELAEALAQTQPAVTQTVNRMRSAELVVSVATQDRRERRIALSEKSRTAIPELEKVWIAIERAASVLDASLPSPLSDTLDASLAFLAMRPFSQLIAEELKQ